MIQTTGREPGKAQGVCQTCKGAKGFYTSEQETGVHGIHWQYCPTCHGTGQAPGEAPIVLDLPDLGYCECEIKKGFYGGFTIQQGKVICSTCHLERGASHKNSLPPIPCERCGQVGTRSHACINGKSHTTSPDPIHPARLAYEGHSKSEAPSIEAQRPKRPCTGDTCDLPKGNVCGGCVNCQINEATDSLSARLADLEAKLKQALEDHDLRENFFNETCEKMEATAEAWKEYAKGLMDGVAVLGEDGKKSRAKLKSLGELP